MKKCPFAIDDKLNLAKQIEQTILLKKLFLNRKTEKEKTLTSQIIFIL